MKRLLTVSTLLLVGVATAPSGADTPHGSSPRPQTESARTEEAAVTAVIAFEADKLGLGKKAKASLDGVIAWLKDHPEYGARLEGHSSEAASREYNLALGEKRASATRAYMVAGGIAPARLEVVSHGQSRPLSKDGANRVEIVISRLAPGRP